MDDCVHFANVVQNFGHVSKKKSKIQKSVPQIFRDHVEVPLGPAS